MSYSVAGSPPRLIVTVQGEERCPYFDEHGHECVNVAAFCGEKLGSTLGHAVDAYWCPDGPSRWGRIRWVEDAPEAVSA